MLSCSFLDPDPGGDSYVMLCSREEAAFLGVYSSEKRNYERY